MKGGAKGSRVIAAVLTLIMLAAGFGGTAAQAVSFPFSDNVEVPTANNWVADSPWARTTTDSHSANTSWTDSPGGYYANNANVALTLATPISLPTGQIPQLKFWHRYQLEAGYDFGYVELSTDGGVTWPHRLATYSGTTTSPYQLGQALVKSEETPQVNSQEPWVMEQVALTTYAGQSVKIRFRLSSDNTVARDGWYIDDIAIGKPPAAVTLNTPGNPTRTTLDLSWSQNTEADFASYRIFRSTAPGVDFKATQVVEIRSANVTTYTDRNLSPKTTYYYRVYVVSTEEILSSSTERSGTTLAGLDYPFYDSMEAGTANWVAMPSNSWALVTPTSAHSGNKAWTDSPAGDYANGADASLVLGSDISVNALSQLVFWHKLDLAAGDNALVELSTDNGSSWSNLTTFTSQKIAAWKRVQVPIGAAGSARIRFRLASDGSATADGWYIDDVSISDLPAAVTLNLPTSQEPHNRVSLSWTQHTGGFFRNYLIYRDIQAGVDTADTLVATIIDQTATTYLDTTVIPATKYYYRVFVVNGYDAYSGSNEQNVTTATPTPGGVVVYPFFDDMESGVGNWVASSPWARTNLRAHSGSYSWTDSAAGNYGNNANTALQLNVNLRNAKMPVLTFWQQYTFQTNEDFGYVDVSTDGTNWATIYFVTGTGAWKEEKIDLTEYATFENVRIRFRLWSDESTTADGWDIDDVRIAETTAPQFTFPFFDDMESGAESRWLSSSWELGVPGKSGTFYWESTIRGVAPPPTHSQLTLAATINLTGSVHPQLSFWQRWDFEDYRSYGWVQVSTRQGLSGSWTTVGQWAYYSKNDTWTQSQIDLSNYAGLEVRIRFYFFNEYYFASNAWRIDDVRISESPADVALANPTGVTRHGATLSWSQNNNTDFTRYEIHRDTNQNVSLSSPLVATITNQATTNFTDAYSVANYYYYRIYVFNNKGLYSMGSNIVQSVYPAPSRVNYPFSDNMESGTGSWDWTSPWGLTTVLNRSGTGNTTAWTDSPVGNYANNNNNGIEMAINLRDAKMPVLTFWQQYTFQTNEDFGYVDISADGVNWATIYFVTGTSTWKEEKIDLTEYATFENVRIRFRLWSDESTTADGWHIDDVTIAETGVPTLTFPFFDDMESGAETRWLSSSWELGVPGKSGTFYWESTIRGVAPPPTHSQLTLAATINLTGSVHPQLTFWQRWDFEDYRSYGWVQVSTRQGMSGSWTTVGQWAYYSKNDTWTQSQIDLSNYAGLEVRLRFYFFNEYYFASNAWRIDDVRISESPADVVLAAPTSVTQHGATLSWSQNNNTDFTRYEIHRDTNQNVSLSSPLVATITNRATTSFTDTYAVPAFYYYRVYVFNDKGIYSLGSNIVQAVYPPPPRVNYPFSDSMESGTGSWDWSSPWGLTTVLNRSATGNTTAWTDSPTGNYANNANTSLEMRINLRDAKMPVLTFWQQYTFQTNEDFGYVDISTDGVNWATIYFVTGTSTWKEEKIDLTEYATFENVRIRFRLWSDASTTADGWHIDDVTIAETVVPTFTFPFFDDMESGAETRWLSSSWELGVPGKSGTYYWESTIRGVAPPPTHSQLTLAATINLTGSVHPQLTFWQRWDFEDYRSYGWVQVSTRQGMSGSWTTVGQWAYYSKNDTWTQSQIDLSNYAGLEVRLRFYFFNEYYFASNAWRIDDVRISEAPPNVVLANPTGVTRHGATLSWSQNNNIDFTRYEIHRDTNQNVSLSSPLVATITNRATTNFTDAYTVANYYYYRVYVFNDNGVYSLGSNIVQAVYPAPPRATYPFSDNMESGTARWDWSNPWGLTTVLNRSGTGNTTAWTDSPAGNYGNNANTALEMAINLRDAKMPVLTFWQQYTFQTNVDFGYVDVSTDGTNWATIYFVTGSSSWKEEKIDLTEYATFDNVRIRFRLWSNDSTTADGWYIDEVRIGETLTPVFAYPFFDDMENPAATEARWLSSSWELGIPGKSGRYYWESTPTGTAPPPTHSQLTLAGTVDLTGAVRPQLTFWHRYDLEDYRSYAWVQISTRKGLSGSWTTLKQWSYYSKQDTWTWEQIDLSSYAGLEVRLRFYFFNEYYFASNAWRIDDIRIDNVDTVAPRAIDDLAVTNPTGESLTLTWTAPGDDGNAGKAWQYDVRYSTSPITAANFDAATQATGEPAPKLAGSVESFTVSGLTQLTTYHIAIKAVDEVGNRSLISNVASGTTFPSDAVMVALDAPRRVLADRGFDVLLRVGEVTDFDAASVNITFDPAVLRVDNVTAGNVNGVSIPVGGWNVSGGKLGIAVNVLGTPGVNGAGYLAVIRFHVVGAAGSASSLVPSDGVLSDRAATEIPSYWVSDAVNVVSILPGDANGDEKVDALDITKVERIVISLDAVTPGADANLDESVNALDITMVERIILGLE